MEELKLILSTVEKLSGTGAWLFGFYLAKEIFLNLIVALVAYIFIRSGSHLIKQGIQTGREGDMDTQTLISLRASLGINFYSNSFVTAEERQEIVRRVGEFLRNA